MFEQHPGLRHHVVLTRRTEHLPTHAGQICFPGGKIEADDTSPIAAALREAHEEIGLVAEQIEVLGELGCYHTITGFSITPVLALATQPIAFRPAWGEVAELFELPLSAAFDRSAYVRESYLHDGVRGEYWVLQYRHYRIWGATAAMLYALASVVANGGLA